jgi:fatty acid-binding protein DegV
VARLTGLKPLLSLDDDGKAERAGAHLGFAAALRGIVRRARRYAAGRPVRLLIAHANAVGAAEYLAARLCRTFGTSDIPLVNLAAVLAAHTGPGAVGLGVRRLD